MQQSPRKLLDALYIRANATPDEILFIDRYVMERPQRPDKAWEILLKPLRATIASLQSSRPKWRAFRAETYADYLDVAIDTRDMILNAKLGGGPIEDFLAKRAEVNKVLLAENKRPYPKCGTHWGLWLDKEERDRIELAFEAMYAREAVAPNDAPDAKTQPPGRKIRPFCTPQQRYALIATWERLRNRVLTHISNGQTADTERMAAILTERYRAANQALHAIDTQMQYPSPLRPPPVQWTHVLPADQQERLRKAEKTYDPSNTHGITHTALRPGAEEMYQKLQTRQRPGGRTPRLKRGRNPNPTNGRLIGAD